MCMHMGASMVCVWQSGKNLQEWSPPLPCESWRRNLGLTDGSGDAFMSQLCVFQHPDIDLTRSRSEMKQG